MENKSKAVLEVLKCQLDNNMATRLFKNTYIYIMYNDVKGFLDLLEYRMNLCKTMGNEDYYLFKFMLELMLSRHSDRLNFVYPHQLASME